MNIHIEDYFGNDIIKLDYCLKLKEISDTIVEEVGEIGILFGYTIADIDVDDNDIDFIRLQQSNVDNSDSSERTELLKLIRDLNDKFL